jgi:hypothetical protein
MAAVIARFSYCSQLRTVVDKNTRSCYILATRSVRLPNLNLVFHDIYEKFPIKQFVNLDFDKLESAARLQFNWTLRGYISRAADMAVYLHDVGYFDPPRPTDVRQMMTDTAKHGRLFSESSGKLANWYLSLGLLEIEHPEFLKSAAYLKSLSEQLHEVAISLDESCQSLVAQATSGHAGRKSNRSLQFLIGHAYIVYRKAGGKTGVYWAPFEQKHAGPFLDMVDELFRQAGWQHPRKVLGTFLYRNQAFLKQGYASLVRRPTRSQ